MDGSNIFFLILIIFLAIVGGGITLYKKSPRALGISGEDSVESTLSKIIRHGKQGKILRNIYIPTGNGRTVEIDLLYITEKGMFVIESKNYAGYIFGDERNKNWTETLYSGKDVFGFKHVEKHHFYNPIWQNQAHIKSLNRYLEKEYKYVSLIVFSDRGSLKKIHVESADTSVCYRSNLEREISNYWAMLPSTIDETEIETINTRLMPLTQADDEEKSAHNQQVNERKYNRVKEPIKPQETVGKCPYCGGNLVIRTAKHGPTAGSQFYGCSNFPKCRYTKNIQ